jgi:glycogen phosphorylase
MFDGCLKRISGSARQVMLLMFIIKKYLSIKAMTEDQKNEVVPRVFFLGGVSRPGDTIFLQLIKYIIQVA